ncbi:hypothetical protein PybrP1_000220 [[Pythium] brassicae (nom. inval.)]|nr:hypothetical protein PybrP1_000220 [[Pythium] brassicae (nom. inval.)]
MPTTRPTSLLNALSPSLLALVEASLGDALPTTSINRNAQNPPPTTNAYEPETLKGTDECDSITSRTSRDPIEGQQRPTSPSPPEVVATSRPSADVAKLNPSELFGFVVREAFLGAESAAAVHDALVALAQTEQFHQAKVGRGEKLRSERAVRGDRVRWIKRPRDLSDGAGGDGRRGNGAGDGDGGGGDAPLHPAVRHLFRRVESVAFGAKAALAPDLDVRNVTSTQFAIFPGDGSRFVRHTDTYSSAHEDEPGVAASAPASLDGLVRLFTCVYYLNKDWVPAHAGQLRVYINQPSALPSASRHWDIPPKLDTLVVFRSLDVEHEVLPTFHERMALTIWYYGRVKGSLPGQRAEQRQQQQSQRQDALALVKNLLPFPAATIDTAVAASLVTPAAHAAPSLDAAKPSSLPTQTSASAPVAQPLLSLSSSPASATIFVAIPSYRDPECHHTVDDLLRKASHPGRVHVGVCLQQSADDGEDDPREYFAREYSRTQVRVRWMDYRQAAGPCVARAEAQNLWEGETFYLQIDSHTRFRRGWDAFLIAELAKCPSAKPILTTYPLGYTLPNNVRALSVSTVCVSVYWRMGVRLCT